MKCTRMGIWNSVLLVVVLAAFLSSVYAQSAVRQAQFSYSKSPDTRIIAYYVTPEMLANPDTTPRVQVFGDGYVWIHYPEYMKRAGDYELYLKPGEVRKLLLDLSGVFDANPKAARQKKTELQEVRLRSDEVVYRSEDTVETFEVVLESYDSGNGALRRGFGIKQSWKNIESDASDFPEVEEFRKAQGARQSLRALLERDDLVRIQTP